MYSTQNRYARLLVLLILSLTLFNISNRFVGTIWGPRYIYETTTAIIILVAAALVHIPVWLKRFFSLPDLSVTYGIWAFIILIAATSGLAYSLPENLATYSHQYIHGNKEFYFSMLDQAEKPAIIFINKNPVDILRDRYNYVAFTNPPSETSPIIFARDLGMARDRKLMDSYPARHVYMEKDGNLIPLE